MKLNSFIEQRRNFEIRYLKFANIFQKFYSETNEII